MKERTNVTARGRDPRDARWVTGRIGARLECGTMPALLDEDTPASGTLTVGATRAFNASANTYMVVVRNMTSM